jgi:hypothetical protein
LTSDELDACCTAHCEAATLSSNSLFKCCELRADGVCYSREVSTCGEIFSGEGHGSWKASYDFDTRDCSNVLSSSISPEDVSFDYDSVSVPETISLTSSWTSLDVHFGNTDTTCCPITSCLLYENDCITPMSSPVSMEGTSPWGIEALKDLSAGYTQTLCVKCSNGDQEIEVNGWTITQNPDP